MESSGNIGGPLDILKLLIDSAVTIELKDSTCIKGIFKGFDEHINVILSKAISNFENHDILFIRGDLISIIQEG
jgi:Small nuclear ribonucleoprotein (snRNP) homolog